MEAMKPAGPRFDFAKNAWVLADAFNVRAQGREFVLAAPEGESSPGRWNRPASAKTGSSPWVVAAVWLVVSLIVTAVVAGSLLPTVPVVLIGMIAESYRVAEIVRSGRPTREDLRLFEDPDDPDVCLVFLTIVCNGESVGTDRGVAWFADGCLLYSGHRTSFAIGGEDVLSKAEHGTTGVALRVARGTASITLSPLQRRGDIGGRQEMRFLKALYHFRHRPPQSRIPRQWPPFEP